MSEHYYQRYGPWCFNETVGFIRMHFLGSQVRGEYFGQTTKGDYLTRSNVFVYKTHKLAPEQSIPIRATNQQVLETILDHVDSCRQELPRRFLDDRWLREVGPFIDWNAFRGIPAN